LRGTRALRSAWSGNPAGLSAGQEPARRLQGALSVLSPAKEVRKCPWAASRACGDMRCVCVCVRERETEREREREKGRQTDRLTDLAPCAALGTW
jgi:hypothetical protein